ncbi:C39 family peptidase [Kitasatospora fiedleri]|uniref:C39 family peptidase n=1 Tax=Kitasatospora fiedleri TaxID=2991545 RepID=UPI00249C52F6|nr:C39 family peptidase [Kitasatospora fiedleri]
MTGHTPGGPTPRPRPAGAAPDHGTAALHRWDGADRFAAGTPEGLRPTAAAPAFPGRTALVWDGAIGSEPYADPFGHRPGTWQYARWTSPWTPVGLDPDGALGAHDLVPSWTATGPVGTRLTVDLQVRDAAGAESGWFTMARWAPGDEVVHRTTVPGQTDAFGTVEVDTLTAAPGRPVAAFRVRAVLLRAENGELPAGEAAVDTPPAALHSLAVLASRPAPAGPPRRTSGPGGAWGTVLDVPQRSQEVHTGHCPQYDGGGEAWAGPACTAMLTAYFGRGPAADDLLWLDPRDPSPDVDFTARAVYDYAYRGCGNWAFNAAYPARYGLLGLVTRLRSLTELERFILAGIPVATAQAARSSELGGYAAAGNIMVVRGFTAHGDVIVNDPLSPTDDTVRRTYPRGDFERVWLSGGGIVYLVHPPDRALPAGAPGAPATW